MATLALSSRVLHCETHVLPQCPAQPRHDVGMFEKVCFYILWYTYLNVLMYIVREDLTLFTDDVTDSAHPSCCVF